MSVRYVGQQGRVGDRLGCGRDRIAESDVDLQCQARAVEGGAHVDAHAAVAGLLADRGAGDRSGVEHDAVIHRDAADGSEHADQRRHVIRAESQQRALDALRQGRYDLLLLDIEMPVMDGFQVLEAMKADRALRGWRGS